MRRLRARPAADKQARAALARWDNEGGAPAPRLTADPAAPLEPHPAEPDRTG